MGKRRVKNEPIFQDSKNRSDFICCRDGNSPMMQKRLTKEWTVQGDCLSAGVGKDLEPLCLRRCEHGKLNSKVFVND